MDRVATPNTQSRPASASRARAGSRGSTREETAEAATSLWSAIDAEAGLRQQALAKAGQVSAVVGLLLTPIVFWAWGPNIGMAGLVMSVALFAWYTVRRLASGTSTLERALQAISPAVILVFPFALLWVVMRTQGAEAAFASWIPAEMIIAFIFFSMLHLRPAIPFVIGCGAALGYQAFFLYTRTTWEAEAVSPFFRDPSMHYLRAGTFLLVGAAASRATLAVRRMLNQASKRARAADLFGKYRVEDKIADGGMGAVYKATYCPEGGFERRVAIKRVHGHLANNPRFVESFRAEARLSARLLHPNIVSVLDFGRAVDGYFMAMEYVDGLSLANVVDRCLVARRPIPPALVAEVGRQVLDGLHFAHEVATDSDGQPLRVVHRDLSPNNVLLSRSGQVKLVDFGIARALRESEQAHTQHVAGNFAYMSPEQAQGKPFDARSDLFAVGALLWEMHARRPLFLRESSSATLLAVVQGEVTPLAEEGVDVSRAWDRFLSKAMARDPADRFPSAATMAAALDEVAAGAPAAEPGALRAFVRATVALKPTAHVESDVAFDHHDDLTAPPHPRLHAPASAPPDEPTRKISRPQPALRVTPTAQLPGLHDDDDLSALDTVRFSASPAHRPGPSLADAVTTERTAQQPVPPESDADAQPARIDGRAGTEASTLGPPARAQRAVREAAALNRADTIVDPAR